MRINLPSIVVEVLQLLENNGYEAYFVGGRVRDLLYAQINKLPVPKKKNQQKKTSGSDYDITTSALPAQIKKIFTKYKQIYVGERHGTIGIKYKGQLIDITTYRTESHYSDGRHPDAVSFVSTVEEDLSRRDITINAIAVNSSGNVYDPFDGIIDLQNAIIRTVGNPFDRFQEDSLRLLRAIRFAVKFNFQIEPATFVAIQSLAGNLITTAISKERIYVELEEIFSTNAALGFHLLKLSNLFMYVFPDIDNVLQTQKNFWDDKIELVLQQCQDSYIAVWVIIFAPLVLTTKVNEKMLQQIFSNYKGLNKKTRMIIINDLLNIPTTKLLLESHPHLGDILHWMDIIRSYFIHDLHVEWYTVATELLEIIYLLLQQNKLEKEYIHIQTTLHQINVQLNKYPMPVNGHTARQLGATGITIRYLLQFWKAIYYRNPQLKIENYIAIVNVITNNSTLQLDDFLEWILGTTDSPSQYSLLHLSTMFTLLDNLLQNYGGTIQIIGTRSDIQHILGKYEHTTSGLIYKKFTKNCNNLLLNAINFQKRN